MEETKFTEDVLRYPEYRAKLKLYKAAALIPLAVVALNLLVGFICVAMLGGFSIDNVVSSGLFSEVLLWTTITVIPSIFVTMNFKAPCIFSTVVFIAETVLCSQNVMKFISFAGALGSVIALYYIMEHADLAKLKDYPLFREEVEFFRPAQTAPMQVDLKAKIEEKKRLEEQNKLERQKKEEEFRRKIAAMEENKKVLNGEDNTANK